MFKQLLNHIATQKLCKTTDKILLAVSGGLDSMVMLHLFHQAGFRFAVAHCNFQLRGTDSLADETLVQETCAKLGAEFHLRRFDTKAYAKEQGLSLQMAARTLRYGFFEEIRRQHGYDYIATAHHINDSLETTILNLARGTGIAGLTGVPARQGYIIRPMLFATREQIERYAGERGVVWREDLTNASPDYDRNFVRNRIVPLLRELNPSLEDTFGTSVERLNQARVLVGTVVSEMEKSCVSWSGLRMLIKKGPIVSHAAGALILYEWLHTAGFNYDQCRHALAMSQPGKQISTTSHTLTLDRDVFVVEPYGETPGFTRTIERNDGTVTNGNFRLHLDVVEGKEFRLSREKHVGQFDLDELQFPLTWRSWVHGDVFVPYGLGHRKKISDFLVDEKISLPDKDRVSVIESGGRIVWVVGLRISDDAKITAKTRQVLVVRMGPK